MGESHAILAKPKAAPLVRGLNRSLGARASPAPEPSCLAGAGRKGLTAETRGAKAASVADGSTSLPVSFGMLGAWELLATRFRFWRAATCRGWRFWDAVRRIHEGQEKRRHSRRCFRGPVPASWISSSSIGMAPQGASLDVDGRRRWPRPRLRRRTETHGGTAAVAAHSQFWL